MSAFRENIKIAVVCSSNMNRSMQSHKILIDNGYYKVCSFGTGNTVNVPGIDENKPKMYEFGTLYETILKEVVEEDQVFYENNGLIPILRRNVTIKSAPERLQDAPSVVECNLIITHEKSVFDAAVWNLTQKEDIFGRPIVVINIDVKDDPISAVIGGNKTLEFISIAESIYNETGDIIESVSRAAFRSEVKNTKRCYYSVFYR